MTKITRHTLIALFTLLVSASAQAHHPLGGGTPETVLHGLMSGIAHPLFGLDHLAFVILTGIAAGMLGQIKTAPAVFILLTIPGVVVAVSGFNLPLAETLVAGSVLALGLAMTIGSRLRKQPLLALFAVAGLLHGFAYGQAVVGASATIVAAMCVGLLIMQFALAMIAAWAAAWFVHARAGEALALRLCGALVAGIAVAILFEQIESALLA